MSIPSSQLAYLRSTGTAVDCDTFSSETYTSLSSHGGPFTGCTSNQAIAYGELMHLRTTEAYEPLILSSLEFARTHLNHYQTLSHTATPDANLTVSELAIEAIMVQLSVAMAPAINPETGGDLHVQTNPAYLHSTEKTVANAVRLNELFQHFISQKHLENSKLTLCVKIPTNYPSMRAARILRHTFGIRCLATIAVSLPQVRLAKEFGQCQYVAVYVNELGVHFPEERERLVSRREKAGVGKNGEEDLVEAMGIVRDGHEWLVRHDGRNGTKMMPASLTSTNECLQLAGVAHITIPPALLLKLENTEYNLETNPKSYLIPPPPPVEIGSPGSYEDNSKVFDKDFAEARSGRASEMFDEAARIFMTYQEKLEKLLQS